MNFSEVEAKHRLPKGMLSTIAGIETGGHPDPDRAVSPKGAIGRFQLMPATAKELGVDPTDPQQNMEGGARYLRWLLDNTDNDVEKAVTAYNYGIGNVWKAEKNAKAVGGNWKDFVKAEESRNYLAKYNSSLGVGEAETQQAVLPKSIEMGQPQEVASAPQPQQVARKPSGGYIKSYLESYI